MGLKIPRPQGRTGSSPVFGTSGRCPHPNIATHFCVLRYFVARKRVSISPLFRLASCLWQKNGRRPRSPALSVCTKCRAQRPRACKRATAPFCRRAPSGYSALRSSNSPGSRAEYPFLSAVKGKGSAFYLNERRYKAIFIGGKGRNTMFDHKAPRKRFNVRWTGWTK